MPDLTQSQLDQALAYVQQNSSKRFYVYDDFIASLGFSKWKLYTPTWATTGTAPAIGNGTLKGEYMIIHHWVIYNVYLLFGSTTTPGTGTWTFSLPIQAQNKTIEYMSSHVLMDETGTANHKGFAYVPDNATTVSLWHDNEVVAGGGDIGIEAISNTVPFTWADTDILRCNVQYRGI